MRTVHAFDLETWRLAKDVERAFAADLKGESPWARPDLFGFGCGAVVDLGTGVAYRYREGCAKAMVGHLEEADITVGYNTAAFDLGVLSACADVEAIRERHVDLNALGRDALDALPREEQRARAAQALRPAPPSA